MSLEPNFVSPMRLKADHLAWLKERLRKQKLGVPDTGPLRLSETPNGTLLAVELPPRAVLVKITAAADQQGFYTGRILELADNGQDLELGETCKPKVAVAL